MTRLHHRLLVAAGVAVALLHLAALPRTLEDLDSVNFALGVESFDLSRHRPHPPGYPLYIAAGKVSTAVVAAVAPQWPRDRRAAVGLAVWSALAAGLAVPLMAALWRIIGIPPIIASLAALLAITSPLFWLTASRPLTDGPGLVAALGVQALLLRGLRTVRQAPDAASVRVPWEWWWAALGAGLAIGVRTQTMWLTGPLLCWCAGELAGRRHWREAAAVIAVAAVGVLAWLIPLALASGGPGAYLTVLGAQGTDDFIGVEMLATMPSWSLLSEALSRTLRTPWLHPTWSALVMVMAAVATLRLAAARPRVLALVLLAFWPYGVFHLTFQETATIRYALPLVVPTAGLAVLALAGLPRRVLIAGGAVLVTVTLWIAQPPLAAYASAGAPIFRAFADLEAAAGGAATAPTPVAMHRRIASESRQALVWVDEAWPLRLLPAERGREVLAVVNHFRQGAEGPVWFLANPARHDLEMLDRRARQRHADYRWHPDTSTLVAFARPTDLDAWIVSPPRWMVGRGWALTPEIGGVTAAQGLGPHREPAEAFLRRDPAPLRVVVGGRHLGDERDGPVTLHVAIDGREVDRWTVAPSAREFSRWIDLPAGVPAGEDVYATLQVSAEAPGSEFVPPVGLEFFDAGTRDDVVWTFEDGWQEPEQERGGALSWRWMSREGRLRVAGPDRDLVLTLSGESPLRSFAAPSDLIVRVGPLEIARRRLAGDFLETVTVPAAALAAAGGIVTLDASQEFVPADRGQSADRRRLALRIFALDLTAAPSTPASAPAPATTSPPAGS